MLAALLLSLGVIFVAELGDRSQLMAMTFALRHRWWIVLAGITAATTLVHLISVGIGHYLGAALPTTLIAILGGIAFIGFGLWTLRGDRLSAAEVERAHTSAAPAFFAVMSAFLLAELGDKTMLATVTLASDNDWIGVWIGSTIGMVAADALAIVVGAIAHRHLPERAIQLGAAALFVVFGVGMIVEAAAPSTPDWALVLAGIAAALSLGLILQAIPGPLRPIKSRRVSFAPAPHAPLGPDPASASMLATGSPPFARPR
ncbi:TMEM165/GDT1 family protein [Skermania sp. ID1734]|uniref:TMEM165/GDT1 family protein n=1 Tax=Skermania sp. ID1734 TaxID=2597516 RepID=UPI00117EFFFD|nr:TMEM165/GDT1 family protein [Skermania sp. ID1734]TSD93436.1 TMEM165/GDT1 family protein [Skermania sp. ID1734]